MSECGILEDTGDTTCPSEGSAAGAASSLGMEPLERCGREDQKRAHLPDLSAGRRMYAFGVSELGRGSDVAYPEVRGTRVAHGWRLRGEKCSSTNAKWA